MKTDKINDKSLIVKSNKLTEACYRLTLTEQRIILVLASMIKPDDGYFKTYRFQVSDLMDLLNIKGKGAYTEFQNITIGLMKKVLIIPESKTNSRRTINWISSAQYFNGKGYVDLCFDHNLEPHLLQLKGHFVKYQLKNIIQLKSTYSIRIFELLTQYRKIGSRRFKLDDLKTILGIKSDEYKLYKNFKTKVLNVAQKELPQKTDLNFTFNEIKTGCKVTTIEFLIYSNDKSKSKLKSEIDPEVEQPVLIKNQEFLTILTGEFGIFKSEVLKLLNIHDEQYLKGAISSFRTRLKKNESIRNIGALALKYIQNYTEKTPYEIEKENKKVANKATIAKLKRDEVIKKLQTEFNSNRLEVALKKLSEQEKYKLEEEFLESMKSQPGGNLVLQCNRKKGFESIFVKGRFNIYAADILIKKPFDLKEFKALLKLRGYNIKDFQQELKAL